MPLPIKIEEVSELYHVTFKTQHDRFSLVLEEDVKALASFMNHYKKKHEIKIFAFTIMSNHVHLLLKNSNHEADAIKHFIRDTKREYAKCHNKGYGENGHFWKRSYQQKHIDGDIQLVNTIVYILNNPVQAKLSQRAEDFAHSSFHLLLNKSELKACNKNGQFINKKELNKIYRQAKKRRYAERLPEGAQANRGLGDFINQDEFKFELRQGRKQFKQQGPWLHYFPHQTRHVRKNRGLFSLALTDDMPATYRPESQLLKRLCIEHSLKSKKTKESEPLFKFGNLNIIFESKTKEACRRFQARHSQKLSSNALADDSIIQTKTGWALVAPPGRRRNRA
jgi:putative transposase